jgi:hypothetical protein
MDECQAFRRNELAEFASISKKLRELSVEGSRFASIVKDATALQSSAISFAKQYKNLIGESSLAIQTGRQLQEAQLAQDESIREMIEASAYSRNSLLLDTATQRITKNAALLGSVNDQFKDLLNPASAIDAAVSIRAREIEDSRNGARKLMESMILSSSVQSYLKEFEQINKQWQVPNEVVGMLDSLNGIQERLGLSKLALPTIEWRSAGVLATLLGKKGLGDQLSYLGIDSDGIFREPSEQPERGILSRRQPDPVAFLSLLLTLLIFFYQEISNKRDKAESNAIQTETTKALNVQVRQIQSLTVHIERALVQAAETHEERYVVRERIATVRSKPMHGASVQGKLLPNEVVRAIDKDAKWIEVEYYHWLHEEYRTGWVLKKYLERVPVSHARRQPK